jgi:hypothetical protein
MFIAALLRKTVNKLVNRLGFNGLRKSMETSDSSAFTTPTPWLALTCCRIAI